MNASTVGPLTPSKPIGSVQSPLQLVTSITTETATPPIKDKNRKWPSRQGFVVLIWQENAVTLAMQKKLTGRSSVFSTTADKK